MKENIFNQITNDNTAYWLGFIAADGSIVNYRQCLHFQFGLSSKDREHLEKFCQFIDESISSIYDKEVKSSNGKYYPASYIEIFNDQLILDLKQYGIVPNKSHQNIDFLSYIPEQYKFPFILGLIDGDGWFTCTQKSQSFGFCGNQKTVNSVHKYLHNYFSEWKSQEQVYQYTKSFITYNFNITTKIQVKEFCEFYLSYADKCDLLERKKETAKNLIQILDKKIALQELKKSKLQFDFNGKKVIPQIKQICPNCKKEFLSPQYNPYKYCSQECAHQAQYRCEHPDKETLYKLLIENNGNFCAVAKLFEISDNTVRKWCKKYNLSYHSNDYKTKEIKSTKTLPKKIAKLDKNTEEIITIYNSIGEAAKEVSNGANAHIIDVCKGRRKSAYGYKWKYIEY